MNFLLTIFIFLFVLFLYLHITHQYKRSEDLEIYEFDYTTNIYLQEVCNVKQPLLFNLQTVNEELFYKLKTKINENKDSNDLKIKDTNDYFREKEDSIDSLSIPFENAYKLIKNDTKSHYFTENNSEFIEESTYFNLIKEIDEYIKPSFIAKTNYDYCTGSHNCGIPLRYHTHFRQFYFVTSGKITIKMTPLKNSKYLHPNKDYDIFEFRSPINVWNPQQKYLNEMDKIKFLEFDILEGNIIFIPPYWWYSIKYSNEDSTMIGFTYNSFMNIVANTPDYIKYFFQQQNIQTKITNVFSSNEPNHKKDEDPLLSVPLSPQGPEEDIATSSLRDSIVPKNTEKENKTI